MKRVNRSIHPLAATLLACVLAGGCGPYENPVLLEPVSDADSLVGVWMPLADDDTRVTVAKTDSAAYRFERVEGSTRESVLGAVLALDSDWVVQLRGDTYVREKDGKKVDSGQYSSRGYGFVKLTRTGAGVIALPIDAAALAQVAGQHGVRVDAALFDACVKHDQDEVDPYDKLDEARECVTRNLPSEALTELILVYPEAVFSATGSYWVPARDDPA